MSERTTHWLRQNAASRLPQRVICLDSEARRKFDGIVQTQTFRLSVASFDRLNHAAEPTGATEWFSTNTTAQLWGWVADHASCKTRTYVFAHNLSYDIRLTEALVHLPNLGYDVRQISISDYGCWAFLRSGRKSIYLLDSHSHIPAGIERIATMLNLGRTRIENWEDEDNDFERRCTEDVAVLRSGMLAYLSALRQHDCGDFRVTGAGQSSAAFRHRFLRPSSLLVHSNPGVLVAERKASWAGRAEVWKHGHINGPLFEYDYDAAYARIAQTADLPARLKGEIFGPTRDTLAHAHGRYAFLVEAEIRTETPVIPAEHDGRILWPTGTFTTTVWDCELALLDGVGGTWKPVRAWAYERAPLLKEWADWILECLDGREMGDTPIGKLVAKAWSRSLIGRFGLRYPQLEKEGELPHADLLLRPVANIDTGHSYMQLQVGTTLYEQTERIESSNSAPAIMGYVMALSRVKLWHTMRAAGFCNVISVDTDGLIVGHAGAAKLDAAIARGLLPGLRVKNTYSNGVFRGPRNLDLGEHRRIAGVPRKAARVEDGVYKGEVWESLARALQAGNPSEVNVRERVFHVGDRDRRREHLAGGNTRAFVLS